MVNRFPRSVKGMRGSSVFGYSRISGTVSGSTSWPARSARYKLRALIPRSVWALLACLKRNGILCALQRSWTSAAHFRSILRVVCSGQLIPPTATHPMSVKSRSATLSSSGSTDRNRSVQGTDRRMSTRLYEARTPQVVPSQAFGYPLAQSAGKHSMILSGLFVSSMNLTCGYCRIVRYASARHMSAWI